MKQFSVHLLVVYRNKKDPSRHATTSYTLSGTNISEKIETIFTVDVKIWSNEWELVAFSHAFLPPKVKHQL